MYPLPGIKSLTVLYPEGLLEFIDTRTVECSLPSEDCPEPHKWSMLDGASCEVEVLQFLKALVVLLKPNFILETGTYRGHSANAMAEGCEENGFGAIVTCDPEKYWEKLHPRVHYHQVSSLELMVSQPIDLLFCDSDVSVRLQEVERFSSLLGPRSVIVIHDTGAGHPTLWEDTKFLVEQKSLTGVFLPTPRGLFIGRLTNLHWR